jgi:hypothetical protein
MVKVICKQYGENNGRSKLTKDDVKQIIRLKKIGLTTYEVSKLWGICQQYVSDIWTYRKWKCGNLLSVEYKEV